MTDWPRLRHIVEDALDLPDGERCRFAERAAGGDQALLTEALRLLEAPTSDRFMEPPQPGAAELLVTERLAAADLQTILGPYRLVRLIGAGGMGAVYEAERIEPPLGEPVAIKILAAPLASESSLRRFERERKLLASLRHGNVAMLLDSGVTIDGRPFLVMELAEGESITRYAEEQGLSLHARLRLFRQVCDAVGHAHRALVIHRDLKPSNIVVTANGVVKLLDFGVAKLVGEAVDDDLTLTAIGPPLTVRYASPEQLRSEPATTSCDTYALGAVLYELVTGRAARGSIERRTASIEALASAEPPPPSQVASGLNREIDAIVLTAMAHDPSRRYRSADELSDDIARYLAGEPVHAHPPSRTYRLRKMIHRYRWPFALAAAAFLLVTTFAAAAVWHSVQLDAERRLAEEARGRESAARQTASRIAEFLTATLLAADPAQRGASALSLPALLEEARSRLPTVADDPGAEAALHHTLARVHANLWLIADATPHAERAVELLRALEGDDLLLADALQTLAEIHMWQFTYDDAVEAAAECLALRRAGAPDEAVADALTTLSSATAAAGRAPEAEEMLLEAIRLRRGAGATGAALAEDLETFALMRATQGEGPAAFTASDEAMALRRSGSGPRDVMNGLAARARLLSALDRSGDAEALHLRALEVAEDEWDPDHPAAIQPRLDLGYAAMARGDLVKAEQHFRVAAEVATESLPDWHRLTSHARGRLGDLLLTTGRYAEAEPHLLAAHASLERMLGADNLLAQQLRARIVQLYEQWDKPGAANAWAGDASNSESP